MNIDKLKIGTAVFLLGLIGVATMLTVDLPLGNLSEVLNERFSPFQIKLLMLINPTILLSVAVLIGVNTYKEAGLSTPILSDIWKEIIDRETVLKTLWWGALGGIIAGVSIVVIGKVFEPMLPKELTELGEQMQLSALARLLYGGITEEVMMRFGLMSLFAWIIVKIAKSKAAWVYWSSIFLAAVIFGVGHLPVVFSAVGEPGPLVIAYILLGNTVGGVIFGWLYWKRGLSAAFIGHAMAHVSMLGLEPLVA